VYPVYPMYPVYPVYPGYPPNFRPLHPACLRPRADACGSLSLLIYQTLVYKYHICMAMYRCERTCGILNLQELERI